MSFTTKIFLLSIVISASASLSAQAGVGSSGGGKGVLCDNKNLRTLDIYESEVIYRQKTSTRFSDLDSNLSEYATQVVAYIKDMPYDVNDPTNRQSVLDHAHHDVLQIIRDIPTGQSLPLTNDATLPQLPSNCHIVQIAIYDDTTNTIQRDLKLWDLLSVQNQAALVIHEVMYKAARDLHAITSDETRRVVGLLMSDQMPEPMLKPTFGKKRWQCIALEQTSPEIVASSFFIAVDETLNGVAGASLYFPLLDGRMSFARTVDFLPNSTVDNLSTNGIVAGLSTAYQPLYGRSWSIHTRPGSDPTTFSISVTDNANSTVGQFKGGLCSLIN